MNVEGYFILIEEPKWEADIEEPDGGRIARWSCRAKCEDSGDVVILLREGGIGNFFKRVKKPVPDGRGIQVASTNPYPEASRLSRVQLRGELEVDDEITIHLNEMAVESEIVFLARGKLVLARSFEHVQEIWKAAFKEKLPLAEIGYPTIPPTILPKRRILGDHDEEV